jgi:hypothetical protein
MRNYKELKDKAEAFVKQNYPEEFKEYTKAFRSKGPSQNKQQSLGKSK